MTKGEGLSVVLGRKTGLIIPQLRVEWLVVHQRLVRQKCASGRVLCVPVCTDDLIRRIRVCCRHQVVHVGVQPAGRGAEQGQGAQRGAHGRTRRLLPRYVDLSIFAFWSPHKSPLFGWRWEMKTSALLSI